jgi:hypothetical protein
MRRTFVVACLLLISWFISSSTQAGPISPAQHPAVRPFEVAKDGLSRGHLTISTFARTDPPARHRVSCPNSGLSSFRWAGQRTERVLY